MKAFIPMAAFTCSLATAVLCPAQTINGVDYSKDRLDPADTFEMTRDDELGQRFLSEHLTLEDEETGARIIALTTSKHSNSKFYQTHPSWTPDGRHIIFRSSRGPQERGGLAYAIDTETFEIIQVTTEGWSSNLHLGWDKNLAYFFKDKELVSLNLGKLLEDSESNTVAAPESYLTTLATIPDDLRPGGGLGIDANENRAFFAGRVSEGMSAIFVADFETGEIEKLADVPFWANHLQANPYATGEILYCWETRGDAPQRMWFLKLHEDGEVENRPLYVEKPSEWVTHELFINADTVLFNNMAHLDRLQENPTGVFAINLRTDEVTNHGQIGKGGFWHCDGTEDGKWIVADTFDGELYRINTDTGEQTLLTTGHRPNSKSPFTSESHSHHNISPDDKWVLLNSSMLTSSDIMLVPLFPEK